MYLLFILALLFCMYTVFFFFVLGRIRQDWRYI